MWDARNVNTVFGPTFCISLNLSINCFIRAPSYIFMPNNWGMSSMSSLNCSVRLHLFLGLCLGRCLCYCLLQTCQHKFNKTCKHWHPTPWFRNYLGGWREFLQRASKALFGPDVHYSTRVQRSNAAKTLVSKTLRYSGWLIDRTAPEKDKTRVLCKNIATWIYLNMFVQASPSVSIDSMLPHSSW